MFFHSTAITQFSFYSHHSRILSISSPAIMVTFTQLQLGTLVQATFLLGMSFSSSYIIIPTIMLSPSPILAIRQWHEQFTRTGFLSRTLSMSNFLMSCILIYGATLQAGNVGKLVTLYTISAIISFFIFPFTIYFIVYLDNLLVEKYKVQIEFHYHDLPEKNAGMQTARVSLMDI